MAQMPKRGVWQEEPVHGGHQGCGSAGYVDTFVHLGPRPQANSFPRWCLHYKRKICLLQKLPAKLPKVEKYKFVFTFPPILLHICNQNQFGVYSSVFFTYFNKNMIILSTLCSAIWFSHLMYQRRLFYIRTFKTSLYTFVANVLICIV